MEGDDANISTEYQTAGYQNVMKVQDLWVQRGLQTTDDMGSILLRYIPLSVDDDEYQIKVADNTTESSILSCLVSIIFQPVNSNYY